MTQDKSTNQASPAIHDEPLDNKRGTRIYNVEPDQFDPTMPRLGKRESEPHSAEVTYIFDVLQTNFPDSRVTWDLHHYFVMNTEEIDIQFDISFFKDWTMPEALSSYKAKDFDNRIPMLAVNVLSKSTWKSDLSENVDLCKILGIPVYAVFSPFFVTSTVYRPPFLRVYILGEDGGYRQLELRKITLVEGGEMDPDAVIAVGEFLPFRFGLMELTRKHVEGMPLFRLILIAPDELQILPTERDQLKGKLEEYKTRFGEI